MQIEEIPFGYATDTEIIEGTKYVEFSSCQ